jgi:exodeoxyribonuclease VII large subunit
VPDREDVRREIEMMVREQTYRLEETLQQGHRLADHVAQMVELILTREHQRFVSAQERLYKTEERWMHALGDRLAQSLRLLQQVDPKRVLSRGYSLVTHKGHVVTQAGQIAPGSEVGIQLAHGSFDAEVLRVNGKGKQSLFSSSI